VAVHSSFLFVEDVKVNEEEKKKTQNYLEVKRTEMSIHQTRMTII
jgi:hypothetical protein